MSPGSHPSDQETAQRLILDGVELEVEAPLAPRTVSLLGQVDVEIDGATDDESVLVVVSTHRGPVDDWHCRQIASDTLKLITLARDRKPRPRLILATAEPALAAWAGGGSWLAVTLAAADIEVVVVLD
jgi:hypothetical protein